ncbi:MATE family multidrug resistance protein [Anseongella ginsenosidimutans]|uniref:Multidrug-efflux transporter n=1 Tax=Anseongella ginsenosidimutans TaxID=496056 RepID=A0A4R3KRN0_9SPHI|nr:MATE family efflux transporter [Anseongella ginsenosidimutans]QEC53891.1 MATE family efflux transporter [Anseongella ginsenosidimutans]TCS86273.1 MATE family multidrug resistance protein [Anseongella ginsenosidimutans]
MSANALYGEANKTVKLASPIILGELAQMTLSLIDTAMVGAVSYKQLAAVALVMSVVNIPFIFGIGMTMSISQMVSMAHGRYDSQRVSHYFYNGFWLSAATALLIFLGLEFGRNILFHLDQDPEVARLAVPFLRITSISVIPMLLFMALKQFTDGLEYTRTAMILSLAALPLNAFLNWLLIFGNWGFPRLELVGAAWGTLISRSLIFFILAGIIISHKRFRRYVAVRRNQWKFKWETMKELLRIGVPSSLQAGMEVSVFAVSAILVGTIGAIEQAAHQIAMNCAAFTFMVSMGLAQGGSIRISNAYGRGDRLKIQQIGKSSLLTALAYGLLCCIVFAVFRRQLPLLFNDNAAVISLAATLLLFASVFQISDATQAVNVGILRGIKDVKVPTLLVAVSYWIIGVPSGYLLAFHFNMGATGIWSGLIIGLSLVSFFLTLRFLKLGKEARLN